jgi:hypothetical protein
MGDCCRAVGFDDRPIQIGGPPVTDQRASWSGRGHRQLRSGCGRGRRCGRNRPVTATRRWRCRESIIAAVADAVVIPFRPANVCFHPLVPVGPVGVLLAVAHSQTAKPPLSTRAVALRDVRLVGVGRISAGHRSRKHDRRRSASTYRPPHCAGPLKIVAQGGQLGSRGAGPVSACMCGPGG